jgi:hypothetical protein
VGPPDELELLELEDDAPPLLLLPVAPLPLEELPAGGSWLLLEALVVVPQATTSDRREKRREDLMGRRSYLRHAIGIPLAARRFSTRSSACVDEDDSVLDRGDDLAKVHGTARCSLCEFAGSAGIRLARWRAQLLVVLPRRRGAFFGTSGAVTYVFAKWRTSTPFA